MAAPRRQRGTNEFVRTAEIAADDILGDRGSNSPVYLLALLLTMPTGLFRRLVARSLVRPLTLSAAFLAGERRMFITNSWRSLVAT